MPGLTGLAGLTGLSGLVGGYSEKVLSYNPIAYWPLWETTGGTAVDLVNSPAQDGAYTGVTLGQTQTDANGVSFVCPFFDGANDVVNIYTTTFRDAFDGAEGTAMIWAKVFNAGVWTDGNATRLITLRVNLDNRTLIQKQIVAGDVLWYYRAGGTIDSVTGNGYNTTDWACWLLTWSNSADQVKAYYNGTQEGATQVGLGAWVGNLAATTTTIGAQDTAPLAVWHGWLAHAVVWDTPLTAPQIADLATV